ncbi:hypothetical protein FB451DRAFT_1134413 [Mycena latifolia]|nr:hypothetical protein FB451DRAFT_1134413 [Mycena latifolia]
MLSFAQDHPLRQWAQDHQDIFLAELLRWDGCRDHRGQSNCRHCATGLAEYRCRDCLGGGELLCQDCLLRRHEQLPLHRIQKWTGSFFTRKMLKKLGLRIQLGHWHSSERICPNPDRAVGDDFVIVDVSGVHEVGLDFCGCGSGGAQTVQLLCANLYPATTSYPRSATTFNALRRFHILSFESKCSAYEFYHSLARETDNTGLKVVKDRYHEFLRMTRQWRHLQMLKRGRRGHDPAGIANTQDGKLTLLCPACPHPGKNLPPDWMDYPEEKQFLFALFLAMDANFRLRRKDVSSEEKDPGLGRGWAFFCEVKAYMKHLKENWNQKQERSHCIAHDAVDKPDREARGTASSGIGAVDCARHNMKRPNTVGDLQLGERYLNMDYMFFKSVHGTDLVRFFVSYDIACQWHINIWIRMIGYKNDELTIHGGRKFMTFLIPKFHLPAHIEACNLRFSFNLTRYVGLTDGEAPERGWAITNPLANSTSEMGPGFRRDTLNNHFNDMNYKKILQLGKLMRERMIDAVPMLLETRQALKDFEKSCQGETLVAWREMMMAWEADGEMPNPFESHRKDKHLAQVRRELAEEAAGREAAGTEALGAVREDMHVTELIAMGIQLEEQQRVLRFDTSATGLHPTDKQRTAMVERTSKLCRKIFAWIDIQKLFFPIVERIRKSEDDARTHLAASQAVPGVKVYEIALWLPSSLKRRAGASHSENGCTTEVLHCEYRLRVGQANEALHDVRRHLLVRTYMYQQKDQFSRGVRANTRAKTRIDVVDEHVRRAVAQYRDAWAALRVLGLKLGRREWEVTLKELLPDDVRGMPRSELGDAIRQAGGSKKKSEAARRQADREEGARTLRIEWAKMYARAMRWSEEVDLLEEEMWRILQFLTWQADGWTAQVGRRGLAGGPQAEGEAVYALRQGRLKAKLCAKFAEMWEKAGLTELIETTKGAEGGSTLEDEELREEDAGTADSSGEDEEPVREVGRMAVGATYEANEGFAQI